MAAMFGRAPALCDSRAVYYALEFWPELLLCCIAALPVKNLLETALEKRNSKLSRSILIVGPKLASLALLAPFLLQARHGLVQSLYLFPLLKKEVSAHETYL